MVFPVGFLARTGESGAVVESVETVLFDIKYCSSDTVFFGDSFSCIWDEDMQNESGASRKVGEQNGEFNDTTYKLWFQSLALMPF